MIHNPTKFIYEYGLYRNTRTGSYHTPDGIGHIERDRREWSAWRDDNPGVTANCTTLAEAAQYALDKPV